MYSLLCRTLNFFLCLSCVSLALEAQERISFQLKGPHPNGLMFECRSLSDGTPITVYWGDGAEENKRFSISSNGTIIELGALEAGTRIAIEGQLVGLSLSDIALSEVQTKEAPSLLYLTLVNVGLSSLDLTQNTLLQELDVNSNHFVRLQLSHCPHLRVLNAAASELTDLDIARCDALEVLDIRYNELENLVLSKKAKLTYLQCNSNKLTTLPLDGQNKLQRLVAGSNPLAELDLSSLLALQHLEIDFCKSLRWLQLPETASLSYVNCSENALSELTLKGLSGLKTLNCGNNRLTQIDLSQTPVLERLYCSMNRLEALDVSPLPRLTELFMANNAFSEQVLQSIYAALPSLAVKPKNPNLFNGGTNRAEQSKTYLATAKNWYPAVEGNAGNGRASILLTTPPGPYRISQIGLAPDVSRFYIDCGDGVDRVVEKSSVTDWEVESLGTIVLSGAIESLKLNETPTQAVDLRNAQSLLYLDIREAHLERILLRERLPLKKMILDNNSLSDMHLPFLPGLSFLSLSSNPLSHTILQQIFMALPQLSTPSQGYNLFYGNTTGVEMADPVEAVKKGWSPSRFPMSIERTDTETTIKVFPQGFLISPQEKRQISLYDMNGRMVYNCCVEQETLIPWVVERGVLCIKNLQEGIVEYRSFIAPLF